jgi:hypothetical protein
LIRARDSRTATCPNGLSRPISRSGRAFFGKACNQCPLQARCTRSRTGKNLLVGHYDALLRAARQVARDPTGSPNTTGTAPWSNAASPGSPAATADCATAAPSKTTTGSTTEPQSTCASPITLGLNHTGTNWAIA